MRKIPEEWDIGLHDMTGLPTPIHEPTESVVAGKEGVEKCRFAGEQARRPVLLVEDDLPVGLAGDVKLRGLAGQLV